MEVKSVLKNIMIKNTEFTNMNQNDIKLMGLRQAITMAETADEVNELLKLGYEKKPLASASTKNGWKNAARRQLSAIQKSAQKIDKNPR